MSANLNTLSYIHTRNLIFGFIVLALMTYISYGLAGGLQNRLSQNPLLIAVLFGIFVGNIFTVPTAIKPAIDFTITYFIKAGVVLVGLKISAQVVFSMGAGPVLVAVGELVTVFFLTYFFLTKVMKIDGKLPVLISAGCAICGAAAIVAMAVVVNSKQKLVTLSVTLITLMGTIQLFLYPHLYDNGYLNTFNDELFGIFAGAGIYELAQVYGAGYAVSDTAINFSTLVKLIKILMLVPMIFIVGYFYNKKQQETVNKTRFPWFIFFFILMVAFNSSYTINGTIKSIAGQIGSFLFIMPIVALGLKTNLRNIIREYNIKKLALAALIIICYTTIISYYYTLWSTTELQIVNNGKQISLLINHQPDKNYYGGKEIFRSIGCAKCHVESLPTINGDLLVLYSDLLIHDMGPALDDKMTQGMAIGTDWRTTPLAGIGNRSRYIHDGRAFTYRDAIIVHDGEAKIVRDRFIDLDQHEKDKIYAFLDSLI